MLTAMENVGSIMRSVANVLLQKFIMGNSAKAVYQACTQ